MADRIVFINGLELTLYDTKDLYDPIKSTQARSSQKYKEFRVAVLLRDNQMCQRCGSKLDLEIHHIKSFEKKPSLRCRVSNGVTLCSLCHSNVHREQCELNPNVL